MDPNAGKFAYFEDPDGNVLYIIEIVEWPQREENSRMAYRERR